MSAVTLIAVASALLDYKREMDEEARKEEDALVLYLKNDQISEIEFTMKDPSSVLVQGREIVTNQFTLKKNKEGWSFVEPWQEAADAESIEQFLNSLNGEKATEVVGLGESPDWAKFGLQKPRGSLSFKDQGGRTVKIDVSNRKNFEGGSYLRRNDENKVLVGSSGWNAKVEKKIFDFRDKRLLRLSSNQIEKFSVARGKEVFEFSFANGQWVLTSKPTWKLDPLRVKELLNSLTGNVIVEYFKEGSILPDDRKKFGVDRSEIIVKMLLRDNKNWQARVGSLKGGVYPVEILDPPMIVAMAAVDGEKLFKLKAENLRDRTTPFEFDKDQVQKIELKVSEKSQALETMLEKKDQAFASLIDKIRALEAMEFLEGTSEVPGGIRRTLQLRNGDGKILMELALGRSQKKKINGIEKVYYTAQSSLVNELMTIDEKRINELGIDQLMTSGASPAPQSSKENK